MSKLTTKERALQLGEALLQQNGYNGFSFQDIADALKIRKPSLYDHFESKEALGNAVIESYALRFSAWAETEKAAPPRARLLAYFTLLHGFSKQGKFCPTSALSGSLETLPRSLQKNVLRFARTLNAWIISTIREGQLAGVFRSDQPAEDLALSVVSAALGGQVVARLRKNPATLKRLAEDVLKLIEK